MKLFNNPAFYETLTYCAYYVPCAILVALETLSYLILIIAPGISSVISTFGRRKLKHRKLPKVLQQHDFGAHFLNFYALLRCLSVATFWRRDFGKEKSNTNKRLMERTISQNPAVQMHWVLCAYVTSTSPIRCELFKGDDTEITNSFPNVAHVQLHRHQTQNQGAEILEPTLSITCCVGELLSISFSSWIRDDCSTAKWASLQGCTAPRLPFTRCCQR